MELFEAYVPFACWSYCSRDLFLLFCTGSIKLQGNAALFINGFTLVVAIRKLEKEKIFCCFADCYEDTVLRKDSESMCYSQRYQ